MSRSGEGATPVPAGEDRGATRPEWLTVALTFVVVFAPLVAWALAMPPYGAPDENDHVRFAVAVVSGTPVEAVPTDEPWSLDLAEQLANRGVFERADLSVGWGVALIPAFYAQDTSGCFTFQKDVTADCQVLENPDGTKEAVTSARLYPKPYYALVGLPSLVADNRGTLYAMRIVSGALSAACLTFAITVARRRRRTLLLGIAVAVTPMVWFMGAMVNPNGTEITLALAWWVGLLCLVDGVRAGPRDSTDPRRQEPTTGLLTGLAVVGIGLAVVRPLSLLWLGLIAVIVMIDAGWARVRQLLSMRRVALMTTAVVAVGVTQTVLLSANGSLGATDPRTDVFGLSVSAAVRTSIGRQPEIFQQMIGTFGWLDARIPSGVVIAWLAVLGVLGGLALLTGTRRRLVVLAGVVVATVVIPVVMEAQGVDAVGFIWQGRYSLPLALGVPLLAARAIDWPAVGGGPSALRRVTGLVAAVTAIGAAIGFYEALRRFTVGVSGPLGLWSDAKWQPPMSAALTAAIGVLAHLVVGWWLYRLATRDTDTVDPIADDTPVALEVEHGEPAVEPVPQLDQRM